MTLPLTDSIESSPDLPARDKWRGLQVSALLVLFVLALETAAAILPGDSSWDTRNYHLYNPFALLSGKWRIDIAAAQLQTYFAPTLDIPYYLLVRTISDTHLLNLILEVPHAIAISLALVLSLRLLHPTDCVSRLTVAVAVAIGATGAATMPVMVTAMSDMPAVCLVLGGLMLLISGDPSHGPPLIRVGAAGFLFGSAVSMKLPFVSAAGGVCIAILFLPGTGRAQICGRVLALCGGGMLGGVIAGGWWWVFAWHEWDNPIFPFFNNIFHSELAGSDPFRDTTFLPKSIPAAVLLPFLWGGPFRWAIYFNQTVGESHIRDPRFAIALLGALVLIARMGLRRQICSGYEIFFVVFFLASFVLWETIFSIFRYLSFLELLTGIMVLACLGPVKKMLRRELTFAGSLLLLTALSWYTIYPTVPRATAAEHPIEASLPAVREGGLVLLLDGSPMAYLALFEDSNVRFLGSNNNFIHPGGTTGLDRQVSHIISAQKRDIWGLETPEDRPGEADWALSFYGLSRSGCTWVRTNMVDSSRIRMCQLERTGSGSALHSQLDGIGSPSDRL